MKRAIFTIVTSTTCAMVSTSQADVSAKLLLDQKELTQMSRVFIGALYDGIKWDHSDVVAHGETPCYCMPSELPIVPDRLVAIMRRFVEKRPDLATEPAGMVMLMALEDVFPCSKP